MISIACLAFPRTFRYLCFWGLHLFVAPGDGCQTKN